MRACRHECWVHEKGHAALDQPCLAAALLPFMLPAGPLDAHGRPGDNGWPGLLLHCGAHQGHGEGAPCDTPGRGCGRLLLLRLWLHDLHLYLCPCRSSAAARTCTREKWRSFCTATRQCPKCRQGSEGWRLGDVARGSHVAPAAVLIVQARQAGLSGWPCSSRGNNVFGSGCEASARGKCAQGWSARQAGAAAVLLVPACMLRLGTCLPCLCCGDKAAHVLPLVSPSAGVWGARCQVGRGAVRLGAPQVRRPPSVLASWLRFAARPSWAPIMSSSSIASCCCSMARLLDMPAHPAHRQPVPGTCSTVFPSICCCLSPQGGPQPGLQPRGAAPVVPGQDRWLQDPTVHQGKRGGGQSLGGRAEQGRRVRS